MSLSLWAIAAMFAATLLMLHDQYITQLIRSNRLDYWRNGSRTAMLSKTFLFVSLAACFSMPFFEYTSLVVVLALFFGHIIFALRLRQ